MMGRLASLALLAMWDRRHAVPVVGAPAWRTERCLGSSVCISVITGDHVQGRTAVLAFFRTGSDPEVVAGAGVGLVTAGPTDWLPPSGPGVHPDSGKMLDRNVPVK